MSPLHKVLVIDDNPDDLRLVTRQLHEQLPDVEVTQASGPEALDNALAQRDFDVVVTDYQLRWTDGTEVLRRVKAMDPQKPVIMFTASGSEEVAVEAMKLGLDDYITKAARHYVRVPFAVRACHERASRRQQVQDLLQSLRERQLELERADTQKNVFIATLAHELRNPLAPVRYSVSLLREDASPSIIRRVREVIERQVSHMSRLLEDLMDLSRISHNRIHLNPGPVDLRQVAQIAVESTRELMEARQHACQVDLPVQPVWVEGDEVRLTQVVTNLLNNAAKFSPPNGQVSLSVRGKAQWTEVEVSDRGVGIAAEHIGQVFDVFTRTGGDKMSGGPPGLGIGLAVVRNLVRLHGGEVTARSGGPGQGATFTVRLPAMTAPAAATAADAQPTRQRALEGLDVVVADDNLDAAEALSSVLQAAGAHTRVAQDGEAAVSLATARAPAAMVLDLGMPKGSGLEVARWARLQPWGRELRLVAVSGWGQDEDRAATTAAGFDAHLVKPVTAEEVMRALVREAG